MSAPNAVAETYDAVEDFWNRETADMRESLLVACGYDLAIALDLSEVKFTSLQVWAQKSVIRLIGDKLAK